MIWSIPDDTARVNGMTVEELSAILAQIPKDTKISWCAKVPEMALRIDHNKSLGIVYLYEVEYCLPLRSGEGMTVTAEQVNLKFGMELANHAKVVDFKIMGVTSGGLSEYGYVLAYTGETYDPWATWEFRVDEMTCWAGHYFPTLEEAVKDFTKRTSRILDDEDF